MFIHFLIVAKQDLFVDLLENFKVQSVAYNSTGNFTVVIESDATTPSILANLRHGYQFEVTESCSVVSVIGHQITSSFYSTAAALQLFKQGKIYSTSKSSDDLVISFGNFFYQN